MQLFYTNHIHEQGSTIHLTDEEAHHLFVLRKSVGEPVEVIDGKGNWYKTTIITLDRKKVLLHVESVTYKPRANFKMHLAIAPPKNLERMEWLLEKATEIGVDSITPLHCERSERTVLRLDRLEKILISACKQSLKATIPQLQELRKFKDFLLQQATYQGQRFIAHCDSTDKTTLLDNYQAGNDVTVLIGPEGDFSAKEITMAVENGYVPISLGTSRLRTETAGIVVCQTIQLINEWKKV